MQPQNNLKRLSPELLKSQYPTHTTSVVLPVQAKKVSPVIQLSDPVTEDTKT
jgi:hypothetical protein